jgi:hypothetical protein
MLALPPFVALGSELMATVLDHDTDLNRRMDELDRKSVV